MSFNCYKNQQNTKDNHYKQSAAIRKSILRHVEVPISSKDSGFSRENKNCQQPGQQRTSGQESNKNAAQGEINSHVYREPRSNKLAELQKKLDDLKHYKANTLESIQDLTKNSQGLANREVIL